MHYSFIAVSRIKGESMKVDIERLGLKNVSVDPETVFTFPKGLAGFEKQTRFKLFHEETAHTVFWLQSLDDTTLMFPVVVPEALDIAYQIELSDEDCAVLGDASPTDIAVAIIVYRSEAAGGKIEANTRSPVILNLKTRKGMQKILRDFQPCLVYRGR